MRKWQRVIPRDKGSPRYRIAHGWKDEFGSLENRGAYFIFTHTHIFSFIFSSYIYFFLYFFSFLSLSHFSPLNSKIASYLPPPPCLDICSSSGKEVIEIRYRKYFSFGKILEIFNLGTIDLP
jgi:hypothetical protein